MRWRKRAFFTPPADTGRSANNKKRIKSLVSFKIGTATAADLRIVSGRSYGDIIDMH